MFNFTTLVLYSILSLGFGYAVGNSQKFGVFKFLFLVVFIAPVVYLNDNKFYVVAMTASFLFGLLYSYSYLFEDFFDSIAYQKERRARKKEEATDEYKENNYRKEQAERDYQQREDDLNRREREHQRRAEEVRREREEKKRKKQEKSKKEDSFVKDSTRSPEEILGLKPGFTKQELKNAYRRESARCHPDKWENKPEHIREMMSEEQKLINWACNKLK